MRPLNISIWTAECLSISSHDDVVLEQSDPDTVHSSQQYVLAPTNTVRLSCDDNFL